MNLIFAFIAIIFLFILLFFYVHSFRIHLKWLRSSSKDFWLLLFSKVSIAFSVAIVSTSIFNHVYYNVLKNPEISKATTFYTVFLIVSSFLGVLISPFCDIKGVKRTIRTGTLFLLIGMFFMSFLNHILFLSLFGLIPFVVGQALLLQVFNVGIKKQTYRENITLGFSLLLIAGGSGEFFANGLKGVLSLMDKSFFPIFGGITSYNLEYFGGFLFTIPALYFASFMTNDLEIEKQPRFESMKNIPCQLKDRFFQVLRSKHFWKFILIIISLTFLGIMPFHFSYILPKYGYRVFGENINTKELVGINAIVLFLLYPIIPSLTRTVKSYKMLITGSLISIASFLIIALPSGIWEGLTQILIGIEFPMFPESFKSEVTGFAIFLIFYSVGEAIWLPRLVQFTVETAPSGEESTYLALSGIPFFIIKFLLGPISGLLLSSFVPLNSEGIPFDSYPNHNYLWLSIGIICVLTPAGLILFRKILQDKPST